jgi:hypothetical protein
MSQHVRGGGRHRRHDLLQPDNIFMFAANYFAEKQHGSKEEKKVTVPTAPNKNASTSLANLNKVKDFSSIADALYGMISLLSLAFHWEVDA